MKATKMPSGNWRVRVEVGTDADGKRIWKSFSGASKKQVVARAAAFAAEHQATRGALTLEKASEKYISHREKTLSPATIRGYNKILRRFKKDYPKFMRENISLITADDVQDVIDDMAGTDSPKTVHNYISFVSAVLRHNRIAMPMVEKPRRKGPEIVPPTEESVRRTLAAAKEKSEELWICLALAALGPLRQGEIAALSIEDVDFERRTVHVRHSMVYSDAHEWIVKEPKTYESDRIILMPDEVIEAIGRQGYITKMNPDALRFAFYRLLRANGIPRYRFHDLRHYCISMLHAKGYPDRYIENRSGHATDCVMRRVYTHTIEAERMRIEKNMLEDLSGVLG